MNGLNWGLVRILALTLPMAAMAQPGGAALSGTVTGPSGAVANARISVKNSSGGQPVETRTDAAGHYTVAGLAPGDYAVTATADGFPPRTVNLTLAPAAKQTVDLVLGASATAPSLADLGFGPAETKGNAARQALLDKRSHMLKIHQRLGIITTAPLIATLITSNGAAGRRGTASGRELHAALGSVTAGLYLTTAGFSIFAPKVPETHVRGPIRLHRALAWIHGPGMILTPVLGALAYEQRSRGERIHGIAQAHGAVAVVTSAAYGLAILSVSIKF